MGLLGRLTLRLANLFIHFSSPVIRKYKKALCLKPSDQALNCVRNINSLVWLTFNELKGIDQSEL